ncbi:hypothetical protein ACHAPJ_009916 [Fusarium lateritium]
MRPSHTNIGFWLIWLFALLWSYRQGYDDPSSFFYKSSIAFERRFSAVREVQVDRYLEREIYPVQHKARRELQVENEFLCIGIPSINRTTSAFLAHAVGSLVDTLTPDERNQIHIVVLLADKDPKKHFAYGQDWLFGLADDVLVYSNGSVSDTAAEKDLNYTVLPHDIRGVGRSDDRVENIRLDHSVLFETCRKRDPTYFALIEDDIIASPNWFTRFKKGVVEVEQHAIEAQRDWMYLRLFYSEIFMGWNNEEIFDYLQVVILGYTGLIACLLVALRCRRRRRRNADKFASKDFAQTVALLLGLWIPACLVLTFVTGRITLHRLFTRSPTVREMPRYGCCAQGMVFPNHHLQALQDFLREPPYQFPGDMIMEDYARDKKLTKWALDPSVMQHVGLVESSDGPRRAEVWNFSFERLRPMSRMDNPGD